MTSIETPRITTPAMIVACLPYLLGFHPRESLVAILLERDSRIRVTMRIDLPTERGDLAAWRDGLARSLAGAGAKGRRIFLVLVTGDLDTARELGLMKAASQTVRDCGGRVRERLAVTGDRWRSLDCHNTSCCPRDGRPVDDALVAMAADMFGGVEVLASRECLAAQLVGSGDTHDRVQRHMATLTVPDEGQRDMAITHAVDALRTGVFDEGSAALVLASLGDRRVRDTVLWDLLAVDPAEWGDIARHAERMVTMAPSGARAPIATVLAIIEWQRGHGAQADIALEFALADDDAYYLAQLMVIGVHSGQHPSGWLEGLRELPREACRRGTAVGAA